MSKALTQSEFEQRVHNLVEDEYEVVSNYKNTNTKVRMVHKNCGREMEFSPRAFYKGSRCKYCNHGYSVKDTDWFKHKVEELAGYDYTVLGEYTRSKDKIEMEHLACGYVWEVTPDNFIRRGSRCPQCAGNARTNTEEFKKRLEETFLGEYTTESEYINARTKVEILHAECGNTWSIAPDTILNQKVGCPTCRESKGERFIRKQLDIKGIEYEPQKTFEGCRNKKELPFDFYLPEQNMCIEFDGVQHYEPTQFGGMSMERATKEHKKTTVNDNIKTNFCEDEGIYLLRIPYFYSEEEIIEILEIHTTMRSKVESPTPKSRVMI